MCTLQIEDEHLPESFKNEITKSDEKTVVIRSNVLNMNDIKMWVQEFAVLTNTKWNAEISNPNGKAMCCRKRYVCHHSSFQKVDRDKNKRGISKNTACKAKVNCKIKKSTIDTRKKDPYVKRGLCGVITIDIVHNHTLHSAEALYFLPASSDVKELFSSYFDNGMGITEAREYHEGVLEYMGPAQLANSRLNPTYRMVKYWYTNWRLAESTENVAQ